MKLKTKTCSTGHGTGLLMRPDLHDQLERDKKRKTIKKANRLIKRAQREKYHKEIANG